MPEDPLSPSSYEVLDPEPQEAQVIVVHPPSPRYWLHILLFLATILSTLCIGARLQDNFNHSQTMLPVGDFLLPWRWALADWRRLALGIPFSACLLGILTAHEMGHYILCVRRGVNATLPFFLPAPTLIGTLGAFIRIKSPIQTRRDLFDIGIAGPIAGFVVAVPVLFIALMMSKPVAALPDPNADTLTLGAPLIFKLAQWLLRMMGGQVALAQPNVNQILLHPMAVAAWVGMFATALNLLPGGQLDGGHIVYALSPRAHRNSSWPIIAGLLVLSWFFWGGWLLWAVVLKLTGRHPPVPEFPELDDKRKLLALFALLMFVITFAYDPFPGSGWGNVVKMIRGQ
ncbi:MAG TPA: site-2 protease family protein [Candidatus Angelobacter sp.]|jgi:membrane-associated protease RseP (regulator of RpoE activity)|nr:site-2 protease family protein [Candidatus Angelobacter sp.]